ncbi:MAG: TolC family protein [Betaproteobacteria bacterium]
MPRPVLPRMLPLALACACLAASAAAAPANKPVTTALRPPQGNVAPRPPQPSPEVAADRARTQAYVDDISADRGKATDDALSFGDQLDPALRALATQPQTQAGGTFARARPRQRDDASLAALLGRVNTTPPPSPARLARREAPAPEAAKGPVFTPDVSRQKSSFAQLVGRDAVDLPITGDVSAAGSQTRTPAEETWSLPDIVTEGIAYSPVLRQAVAQLESAEAKTRQARADLFPTLSTRMAAGRADTAIQGGQNLSTRDYRTSVTRLTQPVYNRTVLKNLTSANASERGAGLRVEAARETVALSLVQSTVNLATARVSVEFAEELEGNFNEVLRYLEDRTQTGAASASDLERARTRVLSAKQLRIDQQASYRSALLELERLLGYQPRAMRLPSLNQLPSLPQTQAELKALVSDYNAELKALLADVDAQRAAVAAQYGRLMPVLSLSAEHDTQDNTQGATPFTADTRLLGVLTWSVSLGGKEVYGGREAAAELRNRVARYEEERKRTEQAIEADFSVLLSATQRIPAGESEQRAARQVVDGVREQLKVGRIGSLLEALDAFDRLYSARVRTSQALGQQMVAQAQLLRRIGALGRIQTPPPATEPAAPPAAGKGR